MANSPSNQTLALVQCVWDSTTLTTPVNNGFLDPVDLNGVGSFRAGDVALIPDDVTGDISSEYCAIFCNVNGAGGSSPLTYAGGPPPTSCHKLDAVATLKAPSTSNPDSQGRHWLLIEGNDLLVNNAGAVIVTSLPARANFAVQLVRNQTKLPGQVCTFFKSPT